ncbi:hypothetical protein [Halovenus marina]|uniref:hypothetical protein n=1 Tax=Halovenus marina TaxID=3396621 RepID=UPI003F563C47
MTETTQSDKDVDALDYQVTVYQLDTYLAVKFTFSNQGDGTITVDYLQNVPEDLSNSQVSFSEKYMDESWELQASSVAFCTDLESGEQVETVYGIRGVDIPDLLDLISTGSVIATQGGRVLSTSTDLDPEIQVEDNDETSDPETNGTSAVSETGAESEDNLQGDETSTTESTTATAASTPNGEQTTDDVQPEESADSDSESTDRTTPDAGSTDRSNGATETSDESLIEDERPPALPANRSDYILEDVREEIESSSEFEWVDLEGEQTGGSENANETGGVLSWARSYLPF